MHFAAHTIAQIGLCQRVSSIEADRNAAQAVPIAPRPNLHGSCTSEGNVLCLEHLIQMYVAIEREEQEEIEVYPLKMKDKHNYIII